MQDAIERLTRDASGFVHETTKDSGNVVWFGPLKCEECFGHEAGILFVSVELLQEILGVQEITDDVIAAASKTFARELLDTCLHEKHKAMAGEVSDVAAGDPEAVATHVAAAGLPVVVRHNEQYRGSLRLLSQQAVKVGESHLHGFILCKAAKPVPGATRPLRLVVQLRGCSRETGEDAPLFRPLSKLLAWGPPPGQIAFVFLAPRLEEHDGVSVEELHKLEEGERREEDIRYFGGFVCSEGGRLLFFPGIPRTPFSFCRTTGEEAIRVEDAHLDHLTLERSFEDWHMTALREGGKKAGKETYESPSMRTRRISNTLVHWFSLGAETGELFYKMARQNPLEVELPEADFDRRALEATRAIRQAAYHITSIAENRTEGDPGFWYFEVLISTVKREEMPRDQVFSIPPWMGETPLPAGAPFHAAERRIEIPGFGGEVILVATRLPGKLRSPFSIGFPVVVPVP